MSHKEPFIRLSKHFSIFWAPGLKWIRLEKFPRELRIRIDYENRRFCRFCNTKDGGCYMCEKRNRD